jgi:hypothetical protein
MMMNIHSLSHRLTVLSMAFLASAALIFCGLGGYNCSFVQVKAQQGRNVATLYGEVFDTDVAYIGVQCVDTPFYSEEDRLWNLSQVFLYISLSFGSLTALMAWSMTFCLPPTPCRWRMMSILASITAVMQVPIFLIFESDNCNFDINRQTCKLAMGAYMNMLSIIIWVIMTIWSQCLKVPTWAEELDSWKVDSKSGGPSAPGKDNNDSPRSLNSTDSGVSDEVNHPWNERSHVETSPEILWASMQPIQFPKSRPQMIEYEEDIEEAAVRDASCMERILSRNNKKRYNTEMLCSASPVAEHDNTSNNDAVVNDDTIQGAAEIVMDSMTEQSRSVCMSMAEQASNGAVCDGAKSSSSKGHISAIIYTVNDDDDNCCPQTLNCFCPDDSKQETNIASAITSCMAMTCDADESTAAYSVSGLPASYHVENDRRRSGRNVPLNLDSRKNKDQNHDDVDETEQIDYLTRRMKSGIPAGVRATEKSKVAPVNTIEIDTSLVREHDGDDHADEISEMTRGSGLTSGVSEVLDSSKRIRRIESLSILEDLARSY